MNARMSMAEKLSVPQLQQAIQSGSLPAYIGIPLIEQKNKERSQMMAAQGGEQKPQSVAAGILQQAEQPTSGIDQLPSNLPTDDVQGMAEGGIVAFAGGDLVDEESLSTQAEADRAYLKDMYNKFGAGIADVATIPFRALGSTGNLINRGLRATGLDVPNIPGKYTLDSEQSMTPFYDDIRKTAGETALPQPKAPKADTAKANTGKNLSTTTAPNKAAPVKPALEQVDAKTIAKEESALDKYARMLMGSTEDNKAQREDAKNMAILQAGLAIAGGNSPNAFQNISAGALPATQQYQQQMSQLRRDDRGNIKELANMELGRQKLSVEEQRHKDQMAIAKMQVDAMRDRYSGAGEAGLNKSLAAERKSYILEEMKNGTSLDEAIRKVDQALGISGSGGNNGMPTRYVPGKGFM
jgi:hypothetical protein